MMVCSAAARSCPSCDKNGREDADLRLANRRMGIRAEAMIETPVPELLPQRRQMGKTMRLRQLRQARTRCASVRKRETTPSRRSASRSIAPLLPRSSRVTRLRPRPSRNVTVSSLTSGSSRNDDGRSFASGSPQENAYSIPDSSVAPEVHPNGTLTPRPRPQYRRHPALIRERPRQSARRRRVNQVHRPVQVRLARPVRSRNDVQPTGAAASRPAATGSPAPASLSASYAPRCLNCHQATQLSDHTLLKSNTIRGALKSL